MSTTAIEPRYLSYRDAEIYCSVSRWTLWRAIKRGELSAHRAGGVIRFDRQDLDEWVRGTKT